jgi:hypothetical protein
MDLLLAQPVGHGGCLLVTDIGQRGISGRSIVGDDVFGAAMTNKDEFHAPHDTR